MTDDLISRKATIEWINKLFCEPCKEKRNLYNGVVCRACLIDDAIGAIETVPSAQQWIPCSERMPGFPSKSLWVNSKGEPSIPQLFRPITQDDGPWQDGYIVCSKSGKVFYSTWYADDKKSEPHWTTKAEVMAWMPLPERYEAE